jgi:enediyne biosynthesis protein E4
VATAGAAPTPWFVDATAGAGILPLRHGEGVNAVDLSGDGLPDLFLPSVREPARLLQNLGNGTFRDITATAGTDARGGVGAAVGDLNLDGRPDIYLARGADPYVASNLIYLQQADGTFVDASAAAGVGDKNNGLTVTLADFNGDGAPEAFLPGWGGDSLYRNDGAGHFADVSIPAGMARSGRGWTAVVVDFDNDGHLDIFATHGSPTALRDNRLYHNRGDGTFEDRTEPAGLALSPWSMGAVSADFDGDGDFDLYVAGYNGPGKLYRNDSGMKFTDVTALSGITAAKVVGAASGPIDNDLLPDLVLAGFGGPVELYKNLGGMKFVRIGAEAGLAPVTRNEGLALADLDDDGDLDLYVSNVEGKNRLYRNQLGDPHFLKLRFPAGGPSLVGAIARLSRAGKVLATRELAGAVGMGQGPAEILFRLPDDGPFDLVVTLPGGRRLEKQQVKPGSMRLP